MFQDLRSSMRMLMKKPGFTLTAIFTLALGIGASAAMFSFFDAVLFKPLAYHAPERLVMVWERSQDGGRTIPDIPSFQEWRRQNQVFSQLSAISSAGGGLTLTGRGTAERIRSLFVSANYFELLGAQPALGRFFNPDEDQAGKEHVAVLTNRCWEQRFGGDPKILGADITLDNKKYTVIGVAAPHRIFDRSSTEVWLPLVFTSEQIRSQSRFFTTEARLKPGVTVEQADAEIKRITEGLARQGLTVNKNASAVVQPLREHIVRGSRQMMMLLMGAVIFILLIACANVANLLLARSMAREREVAVRAALGAGRSRLLRQFLTESVLLAVVSGGMGVILAFWLIKGFTALMPRFTIPTETEATIDLRVLLFTLGASLLTGIIFGLAPAWQASRPELTRLLQEHGYGASARLGRNKLRSLLLVSEIALTFALVIGAALLIRSFARMLQVDPGFQTERVLTLQTNLNKTRYPQAHQLINYQTALLDRMRAIPGAQSVAATNAVPLSGGGLFSLISITGRSPGESPAREGAAIRIVSPGYFETLGIRLLSGRYLSDHDTAQTSPVIVINQSLAKRHWPDRDPIGGHIQFAGDNFASLSFTIVGVIADLRHRRLQEKPEPEVYLLFSQTPDKALSSFGRALHFAVRTTSEPSNLTPAIRNIAASVDKDQPLYSVRTMEELYSESVAMPRFQTAIFSLFGALALALATVGVYGVMAYSVKQRTREIGIRMALGAQAGDVLRLVMRQGLALALVGAGVGLGVAIALTRFLTVYLYEIKATDAPTYIGVALFLLSIALLASYLPARRAVKVDPVIVLRHE
jgi:putative ABC transport system permease protein